MTASSSTSVQVERLAAVERLLQACTCKMSYSDVDAASTFGIFASAGSGRAGVSFLEICHHFATPNRNRPCRYARPLSFSILKIQAKIDRRLEKCEQEARKKNIQMNA
ncbi:MAG TPA: hypothetical protein VN633_24690 [Bryobacteraceae bacterium]|nr:hypothetical protein [Bryobacteraceae bacterium]HXR75923.1 hypothetical protein [Bryobacteraceae bacterium]